ncbi:transcription factor IIIA isoform X2 [Arachis ipaensis]|uniref:transcription factor IIIA isoform X2 n=1 Tax=Arachis ipaensis TaxID=130454 RepID=UPI000A2B8748|nr:transcription factor IIIA isoform X2 [Arachis ipaensis]XP_025633853.1 transcription factor IIIA isoform X3 [Arachis hypogaea]
MPEIQMDEPMESGERPVFKDIRRYFCEYCGICRSKKILITSHINSQHKDELEKARAEGNNEAHCEKPNNTCQQCGASFKKPAYLLQHMQSHSLERPYVCTVDDCQASYRRKDHLTRHLLQHEGKTFKCPMENCNLIFSIKGNMARHVKEIHDEGSTSTNVESKQFVCPEIGCGKVFKFASKLRKHEDSHVKLQSVDVVCLEPGCMKHFTNNQCLKEHIESCHQYVTCDTCGSRQLKKNIKRHLCTHEADKSLAEFKCEFKGCSCKFSSGDFEEADEQFRSRPRGGRKRVCPTVEMLVRKRVTPPSQLENLLFMQE